MNDAVEPPEFAQAWNARVGADIPVPQVAETAEAGFEHHMANARRLTQEELAQPFSDDLGSGHPHATR